MAKTKKIYKNAIVEKRNVLNEIRKNSMSLQEVRFFTIYLSKINARDISTRVVQFPLKDFCKIMDISGDNASHNIAQFRLSIRRLLQQIVEVPNERGGYSAFQLFKKCKLEKNEYGEWFVTIDAHDDALPLMFDFKNRYFTYELWNSLRLRSTNQIRMYEILKQYEKLGKRELPIQELRDLLGIMPDEYPRWDNFKRKVLDSCQQALKENTDICYTYEKGKSGVGGKWLTIVFHIEKNEDYIDQLTLDEFINLQPDPKALPDTDTSELSEPDWDIVYGSTDLAILAEACNYEFSKSQMEQIALILTRTDIPRDRYTDSLLWGRERYLSEKYAALNVIAEKKLENGEKINDRFAYFVPMLENDTYQPSAYKEV